MTEDLKQLEKALEYATEKHKGPTRIGGEAYITHPIAVAEILKKNGYGIEYQIAGLFHDLLEDTDATEEEIEALSNKEVLLAVKLLTKEDGYVMKDYVSRIKGNEIAFAVKGADRLHNLRCAIVANDQFKKKYIMESVDWYIDFMPEIPSAIKMLINSLETGREEFAVLLEKSGSLSVR